MIYDNFNQINKKKGDILSINQLVHVLNERNSTSERSPQFHVRSFSETASNCSHAT